MDWIVSEWVVGFRFRSWFFLRLLFDDVWIIYCLWFHFWNTFFFFNIWIIEVIFRVMLLGILSFYSVILSKSFDYGFCCRIFKSDLNGWLMHRLVILKNVFDELFLFLHIIIFTLMGMILTFFLELLLFGIIIIT